VKTARRIGVVLTDIGGPSDESQVVPFIESFLADRAVLPLPQGMRVLTARMIAARRAPVSLAHYRAIGGKSPLPEAVAAQVEALGAALGGELIVRHAFRHTPPRSDAVLGDLAREGVARVVIVPLFPQRSFTTTDSCVDDITRAASHFGMACVVVTSDPEADGFVRAVVDLAGSCARDVQHMLLVAHGLPVSSVRKGDPYVEEMWRTAKRISADLPHTGTWSLAFQSRVGPVQWVGPHIDEEIRQLAHEGIRALSVVPISFTNENLETRYDLDIEAANLARAEGIATYVRVPAVGCHAAYIEHLAELTRRAALDAGWIEGRG
jgi:ferrochelatase